MSRQKIPYNWTEEDCKQAISQLLRESSIRFDNGRFDESAKMLVAAAHIMKEIPSRRRKEQARKSVNDKIKKSREKQIEKVEPPKEEDIGGPNNPFKPDGN